MWQANWRDEIWSRFSDPWDIVIIGGGITGAGILREAARLGLNTLLVEQRDFGWGTSSRSSKLVHGGLRYLKEGRVGLTRASVRERQQLLQDGPGLIDPLGFLLTVHRGDFPGRWTYEMGLSIYDLLAMRWDHRYYSQQDFQLLAPHITQAGLRGGFRYGDAQTDDARLVLRILQEAVADGGTAINYVRAENLLLNQSGVVHGVHLKDSENGRAGNIFARAVINATGAWADDLRCQVSGAARIRPLRGSHLIFPAWRLPVAQAVSFLHPFDQRPVFIFPWEGVTLVGTTDVDHTISLQNEPAISLEETAYLMAAVEAEFPALGLELRDVISTYAGVRPVIGSGKADPSQESRDHVVWLENGLLTVTGGKLTTFRLIALDALQILHERFPDFPQPAGNLPMLDRIDHPLAGAQALDENIRRRLLGRYGACAPSLVKSALPGELTPIHGTPYLWAELRWSARMEGVVHLHDLLLRRVRLGLLLPQGGRDLLPTIREICQAELGWDDCRWEVEVSSYLALWDQYYKPPAAASVPDWRAHLDRVRAERLTQRQLRKQRATRQSALATMAIIAAIASFFLYRQISRSKRARRLVR